MKLIAGNSNPDLARSIARYLSLDLTKASIKRYADNEVFVEIQENMRGEDVFVIQSTSYPANDNMMELLVMLDALKRSSARRITAVIPYFGYARQDRKPAPRTPISAKLAADIITVAGANRVLCFDLHAGQIQGFFNIPVDNLYAQPVFVKHIRTLFADKQLAVVSPDIGGVVRARGMAKQIGASLVVIDKRRERPGVSEVMNVIGDVQDKVCIIVDDIVDSAGTLCNAAAAVKEKGAAEVVACVTHGVLSGSADERVKASCLNQMFVTDTIAAGPRILQTPNITVLSVAELAAKAIRNIYEETSVSELFESNA